MIVPSFPHSAPQAETAQRDLSVARAASEAAAKYVPLFHRDVPQPAPPLIRQLEQLKAQINEYQELIEERGSIPLLAFAFLFLLFVFFPF